MKARLGFFLTAVALTALLILFASVSTGDGGFLASLEPLFREALDSGNYGFAAVLVFLSGIATSFTPCVYPMIVITVSVFGARQAKSRFEAAGLSTSFVLGMAALFTPLGLVVGLTGGFFGSLLSSPFVLGGLAIMFIAMAASMFGAFELNLPPALQNRLATVGGSGFGGAFALGLVSAVIAAPCTGPVLAVLLVWIGRTGNAGFGALALFIYALGLGLLFWLVGTFSVSLPKSGRWLEWVKSGFGIVMLVMALWYLRDLVPQLNPAQRNDLLIVAAAALFVVGITFGAIDLSYHEPSKLTRARKTALIAAATLGLFGQVQWAAALPPGARIAWTDDYQAAKTRALREGRPLLVDFGASWCGACGELDRHTFTDPRVVAAARDFVPVRIDLSPGEDTPEKRAVLSSYEQRGLPLVVLHDENGGEVARLTRFASPEEFLELMHRVD